MEDNEMVEVREIREVMEMVEVGEMGKSTPGSTDSIYPYWHLAFLYLFLKHSLSILRRGEAVGHLAWQLSLLASWSSCPTVTLSLILGKVGP